MPLSATAGAHFRFGLALVDGKAGFVGKSAGWLGAKFNVPALMASPTFQVRFVYAAGVSSQTTDQTQSMQGTRPGWFVDNLRFE